MKKKRKTDRKMEVFCKERAYIDRNKQKYSGKCRISNEKLQKYDWKMKERRKRFFSSVQNLTLLHLLKNNISLNVLMCWSIQVLTASDVTWFLSDRPESAIPTTHQTLSVPIETNSHPINLPVKRKIWCFLCVTFEYISSIFIF